ncbi:MAG TPA: hypothetical protein VFE73_02140 [Reyranella sp.]|jgi:hypothetical protein|nr:hypothetical protein [Reyranella sp.]
MRWSDIALLAASIVLSMCAAEASVRALDRLPVLTDWLPNTRDRDVTARSVGSLPLADGVSADWFSRDPPPLPNRGVPPAEWTRVMDEARDIPLWVPEVFHATDYFKAYNAVYVGDPCSHPVFRQAPGSLYVFDPVDHAPYPRLRYLPSATTPTGLVTNEAAWRGPPVKVDKPADVVRIVFVGASTTANSAYYPYSYPELVGGWLNIWAASHKMNVRFEALNAGREGILSTDIEAVVRKEVLPFRPELVVYLEGGSTMIARELVDRPLTPPPVEADEAASEDYLQGLLREASHRSALARRVQIALHLVDHAPLKEPPKPAHEVLWPAGLDRADPDLARPDLPLRLSTSIADLDHIRAELSGVGSTLALSSYKFFVPDGVPLDSVRDRGLYEELNYTLFPLTYHELDDLAGFQNRVYEKYARTNGLPFVDVARHMPDEAGLYTDPVHFSYGGVRLHAWIVFQSLVPLIERKLGEGAWPMPASHPTEVPAGMVTQPRQIPVSCPASLAMAR